MGDATNTVIIFAGELLKKAEHLLIMGIHPSEVIKDYELACTKAFAEPESAFLSMTRHRMHLTAFQIYRHPASPLRSRQLRLQRHSSLPSHRNNMNSKTPCLRRWISIQLVKYHASKPNHWDRSSIPHVPSREADLSTTSESSMFKLEISTINRRN